MTGAKDWYSARELAGLPGMPLTERAVRSRAKREAFRPTRKRHGRGGATEYHVTALPAEVRLALIGGGDAKQALMPAGESAQAGALAGRQIREEEAAMAEMRRIGREKALAAFLALPEARQKEAEARFEILRACDAFNRHAGLPAKKGSILFCKEFTDGNINLSSSVKVECVRQGKLSLSWSTLNRWRRAYDEHGLTGLTGGYVSRKGETTVPERMQRFIIALHIDHPHIKPRRVIDAIRARFDGMALPGRGAVYRYIKRWKNENQSLLLYITNPDEWRSKKQVAFGDASEQVVRLNQLWEFDSTPGDIILTEGRYSLIGVVDVYSRRLRLQVTPSSRGAAIGALIRRAILDWGVPEAVKTDNGADYVSRHIVRVFSELDIEQYLCTPFTPEEKPHIERAFRTFSHSIVELLPGYIGHNVPERKAIESRRSFAQRLMEKDSAVELKMSAGQFQEICDRWVNAMYHQDVHASLAGKTPAEMARAWGQPLRRITDIHALDMLLAEEVKPRTVGKKGIQTGNIHYISPHLAHLAGERVRVRLDATDLGRIYVYSLEGEFLCVAENPLLVDVDRAEIASHTRNRQKEIMREGTKKLKKIAREEATREIYQEILVHREAQIANLADLPKPATPHNTPALDQAALAATSAASINRGPVPQPITDEEWEKSEKILQTLERKSGIRQAMPASEWEAYEMLTKEVADGLELSDKEHRWMLEYERFLDTGKRRGLTAEQWQPYAERARIAREATK